MNHKGGMIQVEAVSQMEGVMRTDLSLKALISVTDTLRRAAARDDMQDPTVRIGVDGDMLTFAVVEGPLLGFSITVQPAPEIGPGDCLLAAIHARGVARLREIRAAIQEVTA